MKNDVKKKIKSPAKRLLVLALAGLVCVGFYVGAYVGVFAFIKWGFLKMIERAMH